MRSIREKAIFRPQYGGKTKGEQYGAHVSSVTIANGEMMLVLDTGEQVNAADVRFNNAGTVQLFKAASLYLPIRSCSGL